MKKYIDAYAFRRHLDNILPFTALPQERSLHFKFAKDAVLWALDHESAADVTKVVRCRDCLHHDAGEDECESWNYCKILAQDVRDDWFCASGIKKKEG